MARLRRMLRVTQVNQRDGDLVGLELVFGEICERLGDRLVHERSQLFGALAGGVLCLSRGW